MNEANRKYNDKHYDFWSAEDNPKLIKIICPTEREIALANRWHDFFLWKPHAYKTHSTPRFGPCTDARAYTWQHHAFYDVFFREAVVSCNDWGSGIEQINDTKVYGNEVSSLSILYERSVDYSHYNCLQELGSIQTDCEELVRDMWACICVVNAAYGRLNAFWPFTKARARKDIEKYNSKLSQKVEQLERHLARARELRTIILGR